MIVPGLKAARILKYVYMYIYYSSLFFQTLRQEMSYLSIFVVIFHLFHLACTYVSTCDRIASLGNMQISNSRLCESSKCWVYSTVNHPWWVSMLFHRRGLLWLGSAVTLHLLAAVG